MRYDFYPDREAEMVEWGRAFARGLSEREGHFGVPEAIVAEMVQAQAALEQAYRRAVNPETRTRGAVAEKNSRRKVMERWARLIAKQLAHSILVNEADRVLLGLNVPKARVRHVPPPSEAPLVRVTDIRGADVTIRLIDAQRPWRRARPDQAIGATIFYHTGERQPMTCDQCCFARCTRFKRVTLQFDPALPVGTPIWISAVWRNRRGEHSPSSDPVRVRLGEGMADPDGRRAKLGLTFKQLESPPPPPAEAA